MFGKILASKEIEVAIDVKTKKKFVLFFSSMNRPIAINIVEARNVVTAKSMTQIAISAMMAND